MEKRQNLASNAIDSAIAALLYFSLNHCVLKLLSCKKTPLQSSLTCLPEFWKKYCFFAENTIHKNSSISKAKFCWCHEKRQKIAKDFCKSSHFINIDLFVLIFVVRYCSVYISVYLTKLKRFCIRSLQSTAPDWKRERK